MSPSPPTYFYHYEYYEINKSNFESSFSGTQGGVFFTRSFRKKIKHMWLYIATTPTYI